MPSYLYGLVPASAAPPAEAGILGARVDVRTLDDDIGIVCSHVDQAAVQPRRAHLSAHDRVLAAMMPAGPVLPLRFGIVTDLEPERLRDDLDVPSVVQRMRALQGHVEVQLLWSLDEPEALRRVARALPEVRDTALPAIERGRMVAEAMTSLAVDDLDRVVGRLQAFVADRAPVESRGTDASRVALLVAADELAALVACCDQLAEELAGVGTLRTVPGLPPYTFADLDVDLAGG